VKKIRFVYWVGFVASVITIYLFISEPNRSDNTVGGIVGSTTNVTSHAESSGPNSSAKSNVSITNNVSVINKSVYAEKNAVVIVGD